MLIVPVNSGLGLGSFRLWLSRVDWLLVTALGGPRDDELGRQGWEEGGEARGFVVASCFPSQGFSSNFQAWSGIEARGGEDDSPDLEVELLRLFSRIHNGHHARGGVVYRDLRTTNIRGSVIYSRTLHIHT